MKHNITFCDTAYELDMRKWKLNISECVTWSSFELCILELFNVSISCVTHQISYLYSVSVHKLLRKSRINVATVSLTHPVSSGKVMANGGKYTQSLMHSQNNKPTGVRSGERGGQATCLHLSIHFSGNLWFKKFVTFLWNCGDAPCSWKSMSRTLLTSNFCYLRHHFNYSECSAPGGKIWELKWNEL
jgi:hypothetical protein